MPRKTGDTRPVLPNSETVAFAQQLLTQLEGDHRSRFVLQDRQTGNTVEIDETVYELVRQLLIDLAQNRAVSIVPHDHELTTHEAADLLNVSRGYILKLLNEKQLAYRLVGTHRRIRLADLLALKDKMRTESDQAMETLSQVNQELTLE